MNQTMYQETPTGEIDTSYSVVQSMSKMMHRADLNIQSEVIAQNSNPPQQIVASAVFKYLEGTIITTTVLQNLDTQLSQNLEYLKLQRQQAFQAQMDFYVFQRNIYASLSYSLSCCRIYADEQFKTFQLEYLLLKAMYVFSMSLKKQLNELERQSDLLQKDNEQLCRSYNIMRFNTDKEFDIIQSQYNQNKKAIESYIQSLQNDRQFVSQFSEGVSLQFFNELKNKIRDFLEQIPQSKVNIYSKQINSQDPDFVKQTKVYLVVTLIMIVAYLLKQRPDAILQLQKNITYNTYIDNIQQLNAKEANIEYQDKVRKLESAFQDLMLQ